MSRGKPCISESCLAMEEHVKRFLPMIDDDSRDIFTASLLDIQRTVFADALLIFHAAAERNHEAAR